MHLLSRISHCGIIQWCIKAIGEMCCWTRDALHTSRLIHMVVWWLDSTGQIMWESKMRRISNFSSWKNTNQNGKMSETWSWNVKLQQFPQANVPQCQDVSKIENRRWIQKNEFKWLNFKFKLAGTYIQLCL